MPKDNIMLEIPKEDIDEVIDVLIKGLEGTPTSNDVWTLLAPFCTKHSTKNFNWVNHMEDKFNGKNSI